jgi:hypothetical protein
MAVMIVKHKVADFATWKQGFDSMTSLRKSHGWLGHEVYRNPKDLNDVTIVNRVATLDGALAYGASDELKAGMQKAGVVSQPEIYFLQDEEIKSY